ncbi:hypothetical protein [Flagellimonas marina]|uniref:Uncharacterized protein n=1 Tax=Flagellimonas marina TaxID=1775168 RepID=A0ABV8PIP7_9FLAO
MEFYINIFCYTCTFFFVMIMLYSFVLKPILDKKRDYDQVTEAIADKRSPMRYYKYHYNGHLYFEAPNQKSASRLFKAFEAQQRKFGKMYTNGHKVKAAEKSKLKKV